MTQNLKSNTKLTHVFFETLTCLFHPQKSNYLRKCHNFFFWKMHIFLYYLHLPQVFTILSLPSIHQPPWTTNSKVLMHLKIDLHFFFLNSYELKTTSLSLSLHIHPKKTQDFDSKIFMVHRAIEAYDSLMGHFWWRFWVLGEDLCVINKLSHWLKLWNQFFPRSVRPDK